MLEGDSNTSFFHHFANGGRRKNLIASLDSDAGEIRGQKDITDHIVGFYKNLFAPSRECSMGLKANFWPPGMRLNELEGEALTKPFEAGEIKGAVMEMKTNLAPGPNGFTVTFFQKFWDTIQGELLNMFQDFWEGKLDIKRLNYGVITLVLKIKEANCIKQFRPICL